MKVRHIKAWGYERNPGKRRIAVNMQNSLFDKIATIAHDSNVPMTDVVCMLLYKALDDVQKQS